MQDENDTKLFHFGKGPMSRLCRWIFRILLYFLFCVVILVGIGVLVLQTAFVQNRLRNLLAETASSRLNATVTIEDMETNLLSDLTLRNIRLEFSDTSPVLSIESLSVRYLLPKLLSNVIHIDRLSINGLNIDLLKSSGGDLNFNGISVTSPEADSEGALPFPFRVDIAQFDLADAQITVRQDAGDTSITVKRLSGKFEYGKSILLSILDSSLSFNPAKVPHIALFGDFSFDPVTTDLTIDGLSIQGDESRIFLDGNCRFFESSPAFSLSLTTTPLHLGELSGFFSLPGLSDAAVSGTLHISGTPHDFRHDLSLEIEGTTLESDGSSGFDGDRGLWVELSAGIRSLDLSKEWFPFSDIFSGTVSTDFRIAAAGLQSFETIDANASAELRGTAVSGIPLDSVRLSASWSRESLSIEGLEAVSGLNCLNMSGGFGLTTREVNAELDIHLVQPDALFHLLSRRYPGVFDSISIGGETNIAVSMEGSLDHPSARFSISNREPAFDAFRAKMVMIEGHWKGLPGPDHRIDDITLSLQKVSGNRFHAGSLTLEGAWSGWLENPVAAFSLSALDISHDRLRTQSLHLKGSLHGRPTAGNAAADVVVSSGGIFLDDNDLQTLKLSADLHGPAAEPSGRVVIEAGDASIFGEQFTLLTLDVNISPDKAEVGLSANHENGSRAELEGIVPSFRSDKKLFSINRLWVSTSSPWPEATLSNMAPLRFSLEGNVLTAEDCRLSVNDATMSLHGAASPLSAMGLNLQTNNLEIGAIPGAWNHRAGLAGILSMDTTLKGPWNRPSITSDIRVNRLTGYGISQATDLSATVVYVDALTSVHATLTKQGIPILNADGKIPLTISLVPFSIETDRGSLEAAISTQDLRFSELPIPKSKSIEWDAVADMNLLLSGSVLDPDMNGNIRIRDGHFTLTRNELTYETIEGSILFTKDSINIDNLLIEGDREGRLMVTGALFLHQGYEFDADLTLRGSNFYIPFQKAITARVSPDLHLSGGLKTPRLTGEVTLNESRLNLDRLSRQQRSDIVVVEGSDPGSDSQFLVASQSEGSNLLSPLTADIRVRVPRNAWLKGQDVNAEISGEITVSKLPGEPFVLTGPLNTLRGNYYFMGKNFKLTKGELEFLGLKDIDPNLNIEARTRIRSTDIIITLGGSAQEITIELGSDPPMEESDIISYLVFGRPTDNLGGDQAFSVEKAAMNYVGGLLAVEFRDLMGGVEFIDTFSIEPGADENGFGTVTLGKYVTPELFISRSQSLSENEASYQEITYELTPSIQLETQIGKNYSNSVDLTWEFDF